jgi:hypothetical protein
VIKVSSSSCSVSESRRSAPLPEHGVNLFSKTSTVVSQQIAYIYRYDVSHQQIHNPGQCVVNVPGLQTTNLNLEPETSKSFTLGLLFEPIKDISDPSLQRRVRLVRYSPWETYKFY